MRFVFLLLFPSAVFGQSLKIDHEYFSLPNGLKVIFVHDSTAAATTVAVYYNVGFRNETKYQGGFAHLAEHLMFEGSKKFPGNKLTEIVERKNGKINASTSLDYTRFYSIIPPCLLKTLLSAEADRMSNLLLTQTSLQKQIKEVATEKKTAMPGDASDAFQLVTLPQQVFINWSNKHDLYGEMNTDSAITLQDISSFMESYYSPNNAVIVIAGKFDPSGTRHWIEKYFAGIPSVIIKSATDFSEPAQISEKRIVVPGSVPVIGIAYQMPEKNTPEYFAMGIIDNILKDNLNKALTVQKGYNSKVQGGINKIGNMFDYNGPMLWSIVMRYQTGLPYESILNIFDSTINDLKNQITQAGINEAASRILAIVSDTHKDPYYLERINLLACFVLFGNSPSLVNQLPFKFSQVSPELIRKTINQYLVLQKRTVVVKGSWQ